MRFSFESGVFLRVTSTARFLLLYLVVTAESPSTDETVCQSKYFKARCAFPDEVVLVETARYGRMNLSRCVRENFGYIGCSNDVLGIMDSHCSGRRSCNVRILDENFMNMKPCHEDLKSYLWIEHRCVKVVSMARHTCLSNAPILVTTTQPRGLIASAVSHETGCGTAKTPWRIRVQLGQRINLTLMDFAVTGVRSRDATSTSYPPPGLVLGSCRMYALLKEPTLATRVTVCGGERRLKSVYVSQTNIVDVQILINSNPAKNFAFMFNFEATGCPDVEAPPGGWVQRTDNVASFGCTRSTDTWQRFCKDRNWIGAARNCTPEKLENYIAGIPSSTTVTVTSGVLVVVILGMALAIGLIVLVVGIICLARAQQYNADSNNETGGGMLSSREPLHHTIHLSKPSSLKSRRPVVTYGTSVTPGGKRSMLFQSQGRWRPRFRRRDHTTSTENNRVVPSTPCWNKDLAEPMENGWNPVEKRQSVLPDNGQQLRVSAEHRVMWSSRCTCHDPAVCPSQRPSLTGQELFRYTPSTAGYDCQGTIAFPGCGGGDAGPLFFPGDYRLHSSASLASDLDCNPDSDLYGRSVQDSGIPGHDLLVRLGNDGKPLTGIAYKYGAQDDGPQIANEVEPSYVQ